MSRGNLSIRTRRVVLDKREKFSGQIQICPLKSGFLTFDMLNYSQTVTFRRFFMKDEQFKPYIPADKITPEFTVTSVIMGMLLAVVFGAANAYLGLRVGMTVSASIPAAVISMGCLLYTSDAADE